MDLADVAGWFNASSDLMVGKHEKDICKHASYHYRIDDPGEPTHWVALGADPLPDAHGLR